MINIQALREAALALETAVSDRKTELTSKDRQLRRLNATSVAVSAAHKALHALVSGYDPEQRKQLNALVRSARFGDSVLAQFQWVQDDDTICATITVTELEKGLQQLEREGLALGEDWPVR